MSAASIVITQSGASGAPGVSRDDLTVGVAVTLTNADNLGVRSWRWRLVSRPAGSAAALSNPVAAAPQFTPDVAGSYLVELAVDEGLAGQVERRICAIRETVNGESCRMPAAGEGAEANWDGNENGWHPDLEQWLRAVASGGGAPAAHASSHLPNGGDPLTTAAPVDVGLANAAGSANSYSRSDHVHNVPRSVVDQANVYEDTDWAAQATNAFTNGTENINGIPHTVVQTALVGSWGMVSGSGFVYTIPNNQNRTWTLGSLTTAPYFYRAVSTVPNVDLARPFVIDVHLTGQIYENGNDAFRIGLWEPAGTPYAASTARLRGIDRGNFAGTSTIRTFDGTTVATSPETFAPDCIRVVIYPDGTMRNFYGTWASGWPTTWQAANALGTANGILNMFSMSARIFFAFINVADATPTSTWTIANVRYSRG